MKKASSDVARSEQDQKTITLIESIAKQVRATIDSGTLPNIDLPVRSLDNVKYDEAKGYLELGEARKVRTLTVNTARSFAQTLRLMATSRAMVEHDDLPPSARFITSARTGVIAASTSRPNRTRSWMTSRLWRRCMGCRASSCASTRSRMAVPWQAD